MFRKLGIKWRRYKMGREYRHMAELHPSFSLDPSNNPETVIWKNQTVATLTPINSNKQLNTQWAFIVGSGPSLKNTDITSINDHASFGVNGSVMKFIEHNIVPDYYVICDESFIRDRWEIAQKMFALKPHCLFTPSVINEICTIDPGQLRDLKISVFDNHFKIYAKKVMEYPAIAKLAAEDTDIVTQDGKIGFSLNPNKGVFTAHTVVYHALQIAYGLGFRQIGILGMDLGVQAGETRFYETGNKATPSHLSRDFYDRILPSFKLVKTLCDKKLFSVYNLSLQSKLPNEVIPKVELDKLLNINKPDNNSITEKQ